MGEARRGQLFLRLLGLAPSKIQEIYSKKAMRYMLRFLWNATRGHRLTPWRSPYLLWRIETYCGVKMQQIGFIEFWEFIWHERRNIWRFLKWTGEMEHHVHPVAKGI